MHMPTVSWRSKVLNHRSKDFYFFMYIFYGSRRNFHWKLTDTHAWIIQLQHPTICWLGFLSIACELCTKIGTIRYPSEYADTSKVATRGRSDACGSYNSMILKLGVGVYPGTSQASLILKECMRRFVEKTVKTTSKSSTLIRQHIALIDNFDVWFVFFCFGFFYLKTISYFIFSQNVVRV